jgi:hypothetical protein
MKYSSLYLILLLLFSFYTEAKEQLTVIQTTSVNGRSFVLQMGLKDGVAEGQEVIFGNDNVSIVCKAIEVTREYSLWKPLDQNINIPFKKQDIVSMNTHTFGNIAVDFGSGAQKITPEIDFMIEYEKLRKDDNITIRYSYGAALSQSSSSVSTDQNTKKKGEDFSFEYGYRLSPAFEFAIGGRLDYEIYRLNSPELDIPTERKFVTASFIYHAIAYSKNKNNIYAGVTLGIGNSKTTVDSDSSTGTTTLLPQVRLGYLVPLSTSWAMVMEASVESISSKETFSDSSIQDTTQINSKLSIGIRF